MDMAEEGLEWEAKRGKSKEKEGRVRQSAAFVGWETLVFTRMTAETSLAGHSCGQVTHGLGHRHVGAPSGGGHALWPRGLENGGWGRGWRGNGLSLALLLHLKAGLWAFHPGLLCPLGARNSAQPLPALPRCPKQEGLRPLQKPGHIQTSLRGLR